MNMKATPVRLALDHIDILEFGKTELRAPPLYAPEKIPDVASDVILAVRKIVVVVGQMCFDVVAREVRVQDSDELVLGDFLIQRGLHL